MEEIVGMSSKEIDRLRILQKVIDKQLKQKEAAGLLKLSTRQLRTLLCRLKQQGAKGIVSKRRGKIGSHRKSEEFKQSALALVKEKYEGCGPTLAKEKLEQWDGLKLSSETLRLWMIEHGLWYPRKRKATLHLPRNRRPCFGELIQADGSHHRWLGEEGPLLNLTVLIDDATSRITSLVLSTGETLESYFIALEEHILKYGRPRALYTDRFAIFSSPTQKGPTQMQKSLIELEIELILANSPQAKGRVERANRTLQDRFVKELKWRGIKTIEQANEFAREFKDTYNQKFSKEPISQVDAHRPLEGYDLERILCPLQSRTLLSDCTFQFNNQLFKLQDISNTHRLKGKKIEVRITKNKGIKAYLNKKEVKIIPLNQLDLIEESPKVLSKKQMLTWKPSESHPWKKQSYQMWQRKEKSKNRSYVV